MRLRSKFDHHDGDDDDDDDGDNYDYDDNDDVDHNDHGHVVSRTYMHPLSLFHEPICIPFPLASKLTVHPLKN